MAPKFRSTGNTEKRKSTPGFRAFAFILGAFGITVIIAWSVIKFNPSLYRSMFLGASKETPSQLDSTPASKTPIEASESDNIEFDSFLNDVFKTVVTRDPYTLATSVSNPSSYGIDSSSVTYKSSEELKTRFSELNNKLTTFNYKELSYNQQLAYDQLSTYLSNMINKYEYPLYSSELSDVNAGPYILADTLSAYSINNSDEINSYMSLLRSSTSYLDHISSTEGERIDNNISYSDSNIDVITTNLNYSLNEFKSGNVYNSFATKIDSLGIDSAKADSIKSECNSIITESLVPKYESIINQMNSYKGKNSTDLGISSLENGSEYYEKALVTSVGTDKSFNYLQKLNDSYLEQFMTTIDDLSSSYGRTYRQLSIVDGEPSNMISKLVDRSSSHFSSVENTNPTLVTNERNFGSAFDSSSTVLLHKAVDSSSENTVILNTKSWDYSNSLYKSLAGSTYPGILYQRQLLLNNINNGSANAVRYVTVSNGYADAINMYSQYLAYEYGDSESELNQLKLDRYYYLSYMFIYGKIDMLVNHDGKQLSDVVSIMSGYGIRDSAVQSNIYNAVTRNPGAYASKACSFIEIMEMQRKASDLKGDSYNEDSFNKLIEKLGPISFTAFEKRLYMID